MCTLRTHPTPKQVCYTTAMTVATLLPSYRIEKRAKLNMWDPATFMEGDHKGYTDHPFLDA